MVMVCHGLGIPEGFANIKNLAVGPFTLDWSAVRTSSLGRRRGPVDVAGDFLVGHGADHCQFFRFPAAQWSDQAKVAAESLARASGVRAASMTSRKRR
jgi:hypothetical protein